MGSKKTFLAAALTVFAGYLSGVLTVFFRGGDLAAVFLADHADTGIPGGIAFADFSGTVRGPIVHQDQPPVTVALLQYGANTIIDEFFRFIYGDQNKKGTLHKLAFLTLRL